MKKITLFIVAILCFHNSKTSAQNEKQDASKTSTYVEQMPTYVGGQEAMINFIRTHLVYPKKAKKHKTEGKVIASFVVNTDGAISNIKVIRDIGDGCGKAVVKVLRKMPHWIAGKQNGKNVAVNFTLPVAFRLP